MELSGKHMHTVGTSANPLLAQDGVLGWKKIKQARLH